VSIRKNPVAYLALFIALGGTAYAATSLPPGSVGTAQLRNGSVTGQKLRRAAVTSTALAAGSVNNAALRDDVVTSDKVAPHSLLASDFAPGTIPPASHPLTTDVTYGATGPGSTQVGDSFAVEASCEIGQQVLGGGFLVPSVDQTGVEITSSLPWSEPDTKSGYAWLVTYRVTTAGVPTAVTAWAVCAND
jgi:hypothetical protein